MAMAKNLLGLLTTLIWSLQLTMATFPVVLVVLDGFRPDYLTTYNTPNLDQLYKDGGFFAARIQPEFPASRYPFLASLATGRHVEDHGVYGEFKFAPDINGTEAAVTMEDDAFWTDSRQVGSIWDRLTEAKTDFKLCNWPHAEHMIPKESFDSALMFNQKVIKSPEQSSIDGSDNAGSEKVHMKPETNTGNNDDEANNNEPIPAPPPVHDQDQGEDAEPDPSPEPEEEPRFSTEEIWAKCVELTVSEWLAKTSTKFVTLYLKEPGRTAEIFGPEDEHVQEKVEAVDRLVGDLVDALSQVKLWPTKVNLLVTTTPGFVPIVADNVIDLADYANKTFYKIYGESPVLNIKPIDQDIEVFQALQKGKNFQVFSKSNVPESAHYKNNAAVTDIVLVAEERVVFQDFWKRAKILTVEGNRTELIQNQYGANGYNNSLNNMQSFMIGRGPNLASGGRIQLTEQDLSQPIRIVDIYSLLVNLLDITDEKSSGIESRVKVMLSHPDDTKVMKHIRSWMEVAFLPQNAPVTIAIGIGILVSIFITCAFIICVCRRCCCPKGASQAVTSYRYTQVKHNRRHEVPDEDNATDVTFEGTDDKLGLLTEVCILEEEDDL